MSGREEPLSLTLDRSRPPGNFQEVIPVARSVGPPGTNILLELPDANAASRNVPNIPNPFAEPSYNCFVVGGCTRPPICINDRNPSYSRSRIAEAKLKIVPLAIQDIVVLVLFTPQVIPA